MTAIYKQRGEAIDYVPDVDVSAGEVVVLNDLVGIVKLDIKASELGALAVCGVFAFPKKTGSGESIPLGVKLYWNTSEKMVTTDENDGGTPAVSFPYLGKSIAEAGDEDVSIFARLSQ
jgi:predicted RecA/RadA family phage recombinase